MPTINVDKIWALVSEETRQTYAKNFKAASTPEEKAKVKAPVFNLNKAVSFRISSCHTNRGFIIIWIKPCILHL